MANANLTSPPPPPPPTGETTFTLATVTLPPATTPLFNSSVASVTATSRHEALSFSDLHSMVLSYEGLPSSQLASASSTCFPRAVLSSTASHLNRNKPDSKESESSVRPKTNLVGLLLLAVLFSCCVSGEATLFEVGGSNGSLWTWRVPSNKDIYRSWANSTDFAVGDTLHFRYKNDSVLVVSQNDFETCNASNPIITYFGENTYYMFDLPGAYYFISGELEHCAQGEKLSIHVTSSATLESPPGPPPSPIPSPDMSIVGGSTQNKPSSSGPRNAIITIIIFVCVVLLLAVVAAAYRVVRAPHSHGFRDLKNIEMIEAV